MGVNGWHNRFDLLTHPVEFVTATSEEKGQNEIAIKESAKCQLTGNEVKKLYEEIISESPKDVKIEKSDSYPTRQPDAATSQNRNMARKRRKSKLKDSQSTAELTENDLFLAAQSGDLKTVETCILQCKLNINSTDQYSWTPLMMAAHEGRKDIVTFLLVEGANWRDMIDGSGYDARDLSCIGGHGDLADIFTNSESYIRDIEVERCRERISRTIKREKLWCGVCKCHYYAVDQKSKIHPHNSSTLHLFNDKDSSKPHSSHFYLSGANKGYQLLQKGGWDGESGLGPGRSGSKYPVKTILKRDRLGFGAECSNAKPRVTHFGAHDKNAVKRHHVTKNGSVKTDEERTLNSKAKKKKLMSQREALEKRKEINFRKLFH